jgi:hypothetical protein
MAQAGQCCVHVALPQSPRKSVTWCSRSLDRPATSRLAHPERGYDFVEEAELKWYRCSLQSASKQVEGIQTLQGLRVICAALSHNLATRIPRIISSGATSGITCIVATRTLFWRCKRKLKLLLKTGDMLRDKVGNFVVSLTASPRRRRVSYWTRVHVKTTCITLYGSELSFLFLCFCTLD